ncbi:MAG: TlpA disulfide reductase family protein [Bacteroidota bacterium]
MKIYFCICIFLLLPIISFGQQRNIQYDRTTADSIWTEGMTVPNIRFKDINNRNYELHDLLDKVTLIDFWFTSCKPCIKNKRYLQQFYRQYDINLVSVSVDQRASIIKKYVEANDIPWINVHDNSPFMERFKRQISGNNSYPDYLLITPDKKIFKYYSSGGDIAKLGITLQAYFERGKAVED